MLLAHVLPPAGTGGATEFADSRTAYEDLSDEMKQRLEGLVANHSLFHSRKTVMPEYFKDTDPMKLPLSKHLLAQKHEWSGRMVSVAVDEFLFLASDCELIEPVHRLLRTPHRRHGP